ncbi:hypothetical protein EW145_g5204 [Phellinidium pouzarii]|uniref:Proteasome alpha-type subunits domain-containing protein n=1 Tax=Phellinidium pouzarii TaxID=167371 RepID=A0A4S4L271_9AGAM|nr:hypothetical protein EW145_g5204 [Phellinidium pouzarii]
MSANSLSGESLKELLKFSIELAREAGKLILEGSDAILRSAAEAVEEKKNSVDLVTQYDKGVEELVRKKISEVYPTFGLKCSVDGLTASARKGQLLKGSWPSLQIVLLSASIPSHVICTFIARWDDELRPRLSLRLHFNRAHLPEALRPGGNLQPYYGAEAQGSYLVKGGGAPLRLPLAPPRPLPSLSQALIAVEWGSDRGLVPIKARADSFSRLAGDGQQIPRGKMAHSLRSMGSAALNFAAVASGQLDLYWEIGCWPWDVCAGTIIAQEAGGIVNTSDLSVHGGEVTGDASDKVLFGRKYIVMRAIADTQTEKGVDIQKRLVKEFCETIEDFTPNRGVNTFSPEGRLFQVEYAIEAIKLGSTTVGVRTPHGVILGVEKRVQSPLIESSSIEKIMEIDAHLGCAMSGLTADARTMIDHARVTSQNHAFTYDEPIRVESATQAVCDLALRFGESVHGEEMMSRPFGVALLIAGVDENGPQLFHTDPSGTFMRYDAKAIGSGSEAAQSELQDKWHSQMTLIEAQTLTLKVLKQVMEEKLDQHNVQLAQVTKEKGFEIFDEAMLQAVIEQM